MSDGAFRLNYDLYNDKLEVQRWKGRHDLQVAELRILDLLRDRLGLMDMLDIGVGAGRTTEHFAPLVRRYFGTDIAPNMVDACRRRFPDLEWFVADACNLEQFTSHSFDLVLFSFNGLDYVSRDLRQIALDELSRVLRPGGYLAFSSHNLNFFPELSKKNARWISLRPRKLVRNLRRSMRFRNANRHIRFSREMTNAIVFEGQLEFKAPTYYVRPRYQTEVLRLMGLRDLRLFPNEGGEIAEVGTEIETVIDPWIYYLCRKP